MTQNSKIEWTSDTWNPWQGCFKISNGCRYCYMYRDKRKYGQNPAKVIRSAKATFEAPLKKLKGPLVFVCSWSDFFIEQADEWREEAWDVIRNTPHLIFQILTKRPHLIHDRLPDDWGDGWPNVWLGVTVEDRDAKWRACELRDIPAYLRFISHEPMLEPINMKYRPDFKWVITGGESGYRDQWRPAQVEWFRKVRDNCLLQGVAYFHKQNGGNRMIGGAFGGRKYDQMTWSQFPRTDYFFDDQPSKQTAIV